MENSALELGEKPIGALLAKYALPSIFAMVASSLYNMVDSIFIGQGVGALAISGLAITFPLMNLSAAFGAMVGVGGSTVLSVKLGQHDYKTAQLVLGNVTTLNIVLGIVFGTLCLLFLDPILLFFGASEATLPFAREYMIWILLGNVFTHMYFGLNAVLRSAGHPRRAMACTILTVLLNTVLDPIFIYVFGMGIAGAAIATVLAQVVSLVWQFRLLGNPKELLHFRRGIYSLRPRLVREMLSIGLSPFALNSGACLVVIAINNQMMRYGGDYAVGAFGINHRIVFMFLMIVMGLNQGMQPIAGYNYGARKMDRVRDVFVRSCFFATIVSTACFICGEFFPEPMFRIFTSDPTLLEMSVDGMRLNVAVMPVIGFQMVTTAFFVSIGRAGVSIFLSLTRQMIYLLPLLFLLPIWFELDGVWLALPISDFIACLTAVGFLWWEYRHNDMAASTNS
ncbi:MAG: MATE family efflux transporter [Bacteroidaceae bacterium]|nr:MATE family efflux transporter [Bacteroidaceae bacterium]MCF0195044.1 MATE family efflux transporter [Bacteroidaceae bacterium]